jgi:hypothetical protein
VKDKKRMVKKKKEIPEEIAHSRIKAKRRYAPISENNG